MTVKKYKAYCLDLDGTVYRGTEPIKEAVSFISSLQEVGLDPYYITNNSSSTPQQVQVKLASFGIKTDAEKIMTSAIAAAKYCKEMHSGATVQMIGEQGLEEALQLEGIKIVNDHPDVVIMGIDRAVDYAKLANVCLAIRSGATFIATNGDIAIPSERGLLPGNGSFVKLVEYSTGKKTVFVGKPESRMLGYIQAVTGCKKEEMVMVGDNYDTDILAGIGYGIDTIHVEGGVTSRKEVLLKEKQPTHLLRTLADWKL